MRRIPTFVLLSALLSIGLLSNSARAEDAEPKAEGRGAFRSAGGLMDRSEQTRQQQISVFLGVPYGYIYGGFPVGVGGRYYYPILPNGFIPSLNDEFGVEAGIDLTLAFYGYVGVRLDIPAEAVWRFHFTERFSAYAKLGIGIGFSFSGYGCFYGGGFCAYPVPVGAAGIFFKLNDVLSLRAEVGYPWAKVGLAIGL